MPRRFMTQGVPAQKPFYERRGFVVGRQRTELFRALRVAAAKFGPALAASQPATRRGAKEAPGALRTHGRRCASGGARALWASSDQPRHVVRRCRTGLRSFTCRHTKPEDSRASGRMRSSWRTLHSSFSAARTPGAGAVARPPALTTATEDTTLAPSAAADTPARGDDVASHEKKRAENAEALDEAAATPLQNDHRSRNIDSVPTPWGA